MQSQGAMLSSARSARLRRGGSGAAISALFTISEEDEQQKNSAPYRLPGTEAHPRSGEKKASGRPTSAGVGQNVSGSTGNKSAEPFSLKTDERLRLARERREEHEKLFALRETAWLQREERARQFYEKQVEERRKRLEEQRAREEQRRAAVEEKRKQKLVEEKARHEAVIQRTLERSQKAKPKPNRWSWGGTLRCAPSHTSDVDRRSVSTVNLSKRPEPVITKRLSSSSATLINTPDKATRRLPLSVWESTMVNRLLTPTHSYLARSRSAVSLSGDSVIPICPRSASCHPMSATSFKSLQCRNAERARALPPSLDLAGRRRTLGTVAKPAKDKDYVRKSWSNLSIPTPAVIKRSRSPGNQKHRVPAPSPVRASSRPAQHPSQLKSSRTLPILPLFPGNLRPSKSLPKLPANPELPAPVTESGDGTKPATGAEPVAETEVAAEAVSVTKPAANGEMDPEPLEDMAPRDEFDIEETQQGTPAPAIPIASPSTKPMAGTMDPEEASRLLAEKRRQAREQRDREEEERRREEEAQRRSREDMARRKAEERARREEEERVRQEERKKREEEEAKHADEERAQREREEAERLQKQKEEEEEARQRVAAEQRLERERHFQKEEAERMQRKKRLEEIMKRTRKSDSPEKKSTSQRNGGVSQQSTGKMGPTLELEAPAVIHSHPEGSPDLEHRDHSMPELTTAAECSSERDSLSKENGIPVPSVFEEVINLSVGTKLTRLDMDGENGVIPVVAFRENGSLRPLAGTDEVQVQQAADLL